MNTTSKESVCDSLKNIAFSDGVLISVNEVLKLVDNLESNKSAGMDGSYNVHVHVQIILTIFCRNTASIVIIFAMTSFVYRRSDVTLEK